MTATDVTVLPTASIAVAGRLMHEKKLTCLPVVDSRKRVVGVVAQRDLLKGRMVRQEGQEAALTGREFQLLGFLLDHPHRFFNADKICGQAWTDPDISPEQVRKYVLRIRRILARLEIPCEVVNRPGVGYSLVFKADG